MRIILKFPLSTLNTGDVGSMVAQAMAVYNKMNTVSNLPTVHEENEAGGEETHRSEVNINLDWWKVLVTLLQIQIHSISGLTVMMYIFNKKLFDYLGCLINLLIPDIYCFYFLSLLTLNFWTAFLFSIGIDLLKQTFMSFLSLLRHIKQDNAVNRH